MYLCIPHHPHHSHHPLPLLTHFLPITLLPYSSHTSSSLTVYPSLPLPLPPSLLLPLPLTMSTFSWISAVIDMKPPTLTSSPLPVLHAACVLPEGQPVPHPTDTRLHLSQSIRTQGIILYSFTVKQNWSLFASILVISNWTIFFVVVVVVYFQFQPTLFRGSADCCGILCYEVNFDLCCNTWPLPCFKNEEKLICYQLELGK